MRRGAASRLILILLLAGGFAGKTIAETRRIVVIKLDGVPQAVLERELLRTDPVTHKSMLPWIDRVFREQGTRLQNFYARAISLSAPSWSLLDTGQHLAIRGNAEFDRYTGHVYDYLNFFPFYVGYALSHRVDMPGVEVLDSVGIPLLIDRFPYQSAYQSFQLYQRGVRWKSLQHGVQSYFTSRSLHDLVDEWTIGFEIGSSVEEQSERELIEKLGDPDIRYLDYFTGDYDHIAHSTSDPAAQTQALQRIDALIGRIWTAIESSSLAGQTVLAVISDHGMNTVPGVFSQGYDLVQFFNSRAGGGHHVLTNRHPLTEYKLRGLDPFVSEVITPSEESLYLKGASNQYPTAFLDLDGNERASIYLRNSDLNALQILLEQINHTASQRELQRAAIGTFFQIVDRHRAAWQSQLADLREQLAAVHRIIETRRQRVNALPKKWNAAQRDAGADKAARRQVVELESLREQEREYTEYVNSTARLLELSPADFSKHPPAASDVIPRHVLGDPNTVYDLENYIIGLAPGGLALRSDGSIDLASSFQTVNYFPRLAALAVKNNVQPMVAAHPVDFMALRIPKASLVSALPPADRPDEDAIWLYAGEQHQALILSRHSSTEELEIRYLPARELRQNAQGTVDFEPADFAAGFPLKLWEDPDLQLPASDRRGWLNSWHSEREWFQAIHKTRYSNGILALHEQYFQAACPCEGAGDSGVLERFQFRRRQLAEPDFIVFASDHWNFNVRGFNPGGNHGSFLRISTNSVLMLAGGAETGIPRNLLIEEPYDSLSFVPTVLKLMGFRTSEELPGRPIRELFPQK